MEHLMYLTGIKSALRARDINYADLAKKLKMTESGVKKMLNAKDISFRRVLQICEVLNVLPGQLFSSSEESSIPTLRLSKKQEEALMDNRFLLMIYWRFTIEKLKPEEIAEKHGINDGDLKKSLQKLVSLDLITQRKERFIPKHQGKFRWPDDSILVKKLNQEWSQLTLKKALKSENSKSHRFIAVKLSNEAYENLLSQLSAVFDEAAQTSEREELASSHQRRQDVTAFFAAINDGVF
jgi:DNA-binding Xre family transcriptional regulator